MDRMRAYLAGLLAPFFATGIAILPHALVEMFLPPSWDMSGLSFLLAITLSGFAGLIMMGRNGLYLKPPSMMAYLLIMAFVQGFFCLSLLAWLFGIGT